MGGAAQKTSIADMTVVDYREVDNEALEACEAEKRERLCSNFESVFFSILVSSI